MIMNMNRMFVIQEIVKKTLAKVYLEIGVHEGECFLNINAPRKIAVDPQMLISPQKKRKYYFRKFHNIFNQYHEMTSDDFFKEKHNFLHKKRLDVVFIDGLHTYKQSLADVDNALRYLNDGGVIIMHDCNPPSEAAAHPAHSHEHVKSLNLPGFTGEWCGDVWKTIVHLRSSRSDLSIFVLNCDYGLGVIMKRQPKGLLKYTISEIEKLSYKDLDKNREYLLNLKKQEYLEEFLQTLSKR